MKLPLIVLSCALFGIAYADSHKRQHGAHEHGHATMNIAFSGHQVEIELLSPAMNLVGFEHQPSSETDHKVVDQAIAQLRQPLMLLRPDTGCEVEKLAITSELLEDNDGHEEHIEHAEHDHDKHANEKHGHDDHGKHDDDHAEHGEGAHSDFEISFSYHCDAPNELTTINAAGLFRAFPGIEELDVQWISDRAQSAVELSAGSSEVKLR
jgi:hypothetical protein